MFPQDVQEFNFEIVIEFRNDSYRTNWLAQKVVKNLDMQILPIKSLSTSSAEIDPKELPFPFDLPPDEFYLEMVVLQQKLQRPDLLLYFPFFLSLSNAK